MKKSELRQIIKEEIKKVLKENIDPKIATFFEEAYLYADDNHINNFSIQDVFRAIEDNYGKVSPGDPTYPTLEEVMATFENMPNVFQIKSPEHGIITISIISRNMGKFGIRTGGNLMGFN